MATDEPCGDLLGASLFSEPADEARTVGDEGLLRSSKRRSPTSAPPRTSTGADGTGVSIATRATFDHLLHDEERRERALLARHAAVNNHVGLTGAGQPRG